MLGDGRVIPMMSYGLIEYLMGLDLSSFEVLELGGGHSTEFWAQRVRSVDDTGDRFQLGRYPEVQGPCEC